MKLTYLQPCRYSLIQMNSSTPSAIELTFFAKYKAAPALRAIISCTEDFSPAKASRINCKLSSGDWAEISERVPKISQNLWEKFHTQK